MKKLQALIKVLNWMGNVLFPSKWKGYRTFIVALIVFLIGLIQLILDSTIPQVACDNWGIWCNFDESEFYSWLLMLIGWLNAVLRSITTTPPLKS